LASLSVYFYAMPFLESSYQSPALLPHAHAQTIVPSLFRRVPVRYRRERITTPDNDFLDLDWALSVNNDQLKVRSEAFLSANHSSPFTLNSSLIILSHGLEGSSAGQYITGMVRHLTAHGYDCLAWNFRSCSGELNRQLRFYHSGATDDLDLVVQHAIGQGYTDISLIGFSLGGNLTLKYLGDGSAHWRGAAGLPAAVRRAVTFSVPIDLAASSRMLDRGFSRVYLRRFLTRLGAKVRAKARLFPDRISADGYDKIRTFNQFDDRYTAPLHGFRDAQDYYIQNGAIRFLAGITVPTLLVNAQNDPFLAPTCFPADQARELTSVFMEFPAQGGHCGFPTGRRWTDIMTGTYWSEHRTLAFLQAH
jgi:uncharacterized protein